MSTQFSLDTFDWAILALLQKDNSVSQRSIAEQVHLSAPAVQRRIRRLQDSGVIQANVSVMDPLQLGLPITILLEVQLHSERPDLVAPLIQRIENEAAVQQCYFITGSYDYSLIVVVASMQEYEQLTARLFGEDHNIQHYRTSVVLKRLKVGLALPLKGPV